MITSAELCEKERDYRIAKLELGVMKAYLWLNTQWDVVFDKKPTQKDKEYYIQLEVQEMETDVTILRAEYHHLKRLYEAEQETGDVCVRCL